MTHTQPAAKKAPTIRPLPEDVLRMLREQAKFKSQSAMADELGISTSAVNQAVHDKYRGNVE
ncbi:helix-turn-helix transcriptional regulator, partial [Citrobacter braakii]|uniref:helix-turn-helix transcriptional regulator n=1 Tax=Citrobacter braakii TaxID=57706 RepID=UPI00197DAE1C